MNARLWVAFLAVMGSTGCIVVAGSGGTGGGGGSRRPGDVTFTWSFAGKECNQASEVKSVKITIPGQSLENAGVYPCSQAGVSDVYINFVDAQGNLVYGTQGDPKPCTSAGVEYPFLKPGTYSVRMVAAGTNNRLYESNYTSPPTVTAVAGQFAAMSSAVNVQLFRTR